MKQTSLLLPDSPRSGDIKVWVHNGTEWLDLTMNIKEITFQSYLPPTGL